MDFEKWYKELISDERWYEQASMNHMKETFKRVANVVFVNGLADSRAFEVVPMREHRQHVYNKVLKLPQDKVKKQWFDVPAYRPIGSEPEWKPVTWEERAKRLKEFQDMVESSPIMKPPAPLTAREKLNQDVRPLPPDIKEPTEVQKRAAYYQHLKLAQHARTVTFLEAFPDASGEEIEEYVSKFKHIDNPLGI